SGFEQEEEDAHVTLTPVLDTQKTREITSATTVPLPPPFFNPLQQEATPTPIPTTLETTTSVLALLDFASRSRSDGTGAYCIEKNPSSFRVYTKSMLHVDWGITTRSRNPSFLGFLLLRYIVSDSFVGPGRFGRCHGLHTSHDRGDLRSLELPMFTFLCDVDWIVQLVAAYVFQYAKALSSITAIMDCYMDTKLGEAINKAIQAHNFNCKEEAQAKKKEYIKLVDSTVKKIIKEEVNTQLPQILPHAISYVATLVIEKNVTESLEVAVSTRKLRKEAKPSKDSRSMENKYL
nr:hypothetical protein [Tanacetum cinerariifolium]